jgi:hypothetical protein
MNKKLVLAAALVFGVAGLILAQGTKAQMATDNTTTNTDNAAMNADNAAKNAENAAANMAQ